MRMKHFRGNVYIFLLLIADSEHNISIVLENFENKKRMRKKRNYELLSIIIEAMNMKVL